MTEQFRAFFVSMDPALSATGLTSDVLYDAVGLNTGNKMFCSAVWRQIAWTRAEYGYRFDPDYVNAGFDVVVIPAANWMYEHFDFGWLADLVVRLTVPVVLIGVGAQATERDAIPDLPDGSVRFLRAVSERTVSIGSRGPFSSDVLDRYGIRNHVPVGCPSLYFDLEQARAIQMPARLERVAIGGTRYGRPRGRLRGSEARQQQIYALAFAEGLDIVFQSERPEFDYLVERTPERATDVSKQDMLRYYGAGSATELVNYLDAHGRLYFDAEDWIAAMDNHDAYAGSRIHGAIASVVAGTAAVVLAHDARTAELAEFAGIPYVLLDEFATVDLALIKDLIGTADFANYGRTADANRTRYVEFLEANALPHRLQLTGTAPMSESISSP